MKDRIIAAAAQEMNERGIKFTVDAVAARLGISKKTLYLHYASKDSLITAIFEAMLADIESRRNEIMESDQPLPQKIIGLLTVRPSSFAQMNDWVVEDIRRCKPNEWRKIEQFRRQHVAILGELMEQGKCSGHVRAVDGRVAAQMLYGAFTELLNTRFLAQNDISLKQAMENVSDIFLYGILNTVRSEKE